MNIVVNADDLGISTIVNKEIEAAIKAGIISSSTIIANGPAVQDAVELAKKYPNISFGIHLNIVEFKPLTNSKIFSIHNLLDDSGNFIEGAIYQVKLTRELIVAIEEEFDAQISFLKNQGVPISHIDSHQHTHTIWGLKNVMIKLIQKHKINKIRRPMIISRKMVRTEKRKMSIVFEKDIKHKSKRNIFLRAAAYYNGILKRYVWIIQMRRHAKLTDFFVDYRLAVFCASDIKKYVKNGTLELMCHPGHEMYAPENILLWNKEIYKLYKFLLISYLKL